MLFQDYSFSGLEKKLQYSVQLRGLHTSTAGFSASIFPFPGCEGNRMVKRGICCALLEWFFSFTNHYKFGSLTVCILHLGLSFTYHTPPAQPQPNNLQIYFQDPSSTLIGRKEAVKDFSQPLQSSLYASPRFTLIRVLTSNNLLETQLLTGTFLAITMMENVVVLTFTSTNRT